LVDSFRSEFEARVQVDLSVRSAGGGELDVACDATRALARWRPRTGGEFRRSILAPAAPRDLIDALLVAVAELVAEGAPTPTSTEGKEPAREDEAPGGPAEKPEPTASNPRDEPERAKGPPASQGSAWELPVGLSLGTGIAWYGASWTCVTSANLAIVLGLPSNFVARAGAEYGIAFGAGNDNVAIHTLGAKALVSRWFGPGRAFEVGLGATLGTVSVNSSEPVTPDAVSRNYFGVLAEARYALEVGPLRFALGPEVRLHLAPVTVLVDNRTIYEVPDVAAGISLDVTTRIYKRLW
jgi:hypothetical protein